jgi:hypothetical protein
MHICLWSMACESYNLSRYQRHAHRHSDFQDVPQILFIVENSSGDMFSTVPSFSNAVDEDIMCSLPPALQNTPAPSVSIWGAQPQSLLSVHTSVPETSAWPASVPVAIAQVASTDADDDYDDEVVLFKDPGHQSKVITLPSTLSCYLLSALLICLLHTSN